jgi:hypothetical protein
LNYHKNFAGTSNKSSKRPHQLIKINNNIRAYALRLTNHKFLKGFWLAMEGLYCIDAIGKAGGKMSIALGHVY